jgi:hypothetical protein
MLCAFGNWQCLVEVAVDTFVVFVTGSWDVSSGAAGPLLGVSVGAGVVEMDGARFLSSRRLALSRLSAARLNAVALRMS